MCWRVDEAAGIIRVCVSAECLCVLICVASGVCLCVGCIGVCVYACVCVPARNTRSVLLLVGPKGAEMQQPCQF